VKNRVFLKLGGSLITDKSVPHKARIEIIRALAGEIRLALQSLPEMQLLVGHGSGSFGHVPANKFHTRSGVRSADEWKGFAQVWYEARALNQIVTEQFADAGLPVISLPPSAAAIATDGKVSQWDFTPIQAAFEHGLVPIIQGDVIFDTIRGGTILSTEELFCHLAGILHHDLILIGGSEDGVWEDYPKRTHLLARITPAEYPEIAQKIFPSGAVDVTGGMASKVAAMVDLVRTQPELSVIIFNPTEAGALTAAFDARTTGTMICSQR